MAQGQYPKIFIPTDQHIWDNDFDFGDANTDMVYLLKDKVMDILDHALEENEEIGEPERRSLQTRRSRRCHSPRW